MSFAELKKAVLNQNAKKVKSILTLNPKIIFEVDPDDHNTILHYAAMANVDVIKVVIDHLKKINQLTAQFIFKNKKGETPFHVVVKKNKSEAIQFFLDALTPDSERVIRMCDNAGKLPCEILQTNPHFKFSKFMHIVLDKLFNRMLVNQAKPLNELLKPKDVFQIPVAKDDVKAKRNVLVAYHLVNRVRKIMSASCSHPDTNRYSKKKKTRVYKHLGVTRQLFQKQIKMMLGKDEKDEKSRVASKPASIAKLLIDKQLKLLLTKQIRDESSPSITYDIVKSTKHGNCEEGAYLGVEIAKRLFPSVQTRVTETTRGDHVFLIIDPEDDERAVVCDPWYGTIYPLRELSSKLKCHKTLEYNNKRYQIIVDFNPRFHKLDTLAEYAPKQMVATQEEQVILSLSYASLFKPKLNDKTQRSLERVVASQQDYKLRV